MSCGVSYMTEVFLSHQDYGKNIYQVQDKIDEIEINIQNTQTKINMFAAANPKDLIPKDWGEESIRWINNEVDELIEYLHECVIHKYQLKMYKEYLEENESKDDK